MLREEVDEEMVCQHCEEACWLKEDPCAMAEMKKRMEGEATVERDSLEAFFLRLLLLDNIKQEAQVHCQLLKSQHGSAVLPIILSSLVLRR